MVSKRLTAIAKDYLSMQGIKAELANMEEAWHDITKKPRPYSNILLADIEGDWLDIQDYNPIMEWEDLVERYSIFKWAYIEELII